MPRIHTKVKSARGKVYNCQSCHQPITEGQAFYEWSRRFGRSGMTYRQHAGCGRPRPTQLSSRKTAVLEEAVDAADFTVFSPELDISTLDENGGSIEIDVSELETMLEEIAEIAREIGQEYQDGFDNMPEGLNQGSTAQAMEEVAQELDSWADDLVSNADLDGDFNYDGLTIVDDKDAGSEAEQREQWEQEVQDEWDSKVGELVSNAQDACQDYPEYQG